MTHMWRQSIWLFIILILVFVPEQFLAQENTETPTIPPTVTLSPTETATIEATLAPEIIPEVTDLPIEPEVTTEVTEISEATVELTTEVTVDALPSPAETEDLLAPQSEPELTAIVSDGFVTESNPNWTLGTGWQLIPLDGNFALQGTGTAETVSYSAETFADVAVEAVLQSQTVTANLIIRQSEAGHYRLSLSPDGQVAIYRDETVLASTTVVASTPEQWRHIRFSAMGYTLRVTIDGVEVLATTDAQPLPAGTVAFTGSSSTPDGTVLVDNVRIWIPASETIVSTATAEVTEEIPATTVQLTPSEMPIVRPVVDWDELTSFEFNDEDRMFFQWDTYTAWSYVAGVHDQAFQFGGGVEPLVYPLNSLLNVAVETSFLATGSPFTLSIRDSFESAYIAEIYATGDVNLLRNGVVVANTIIANFNASTWHTLRFEAIQDILSLTVDGAEVILYQDTDPLSGGRIVFGKNSDVSATLTIDNIHIWMPYQEIPWRLHSIRTSRVNALSNNGLVQLAYVSTVSSETELLADIAYINDNCPSLSEQHEITLASDIALTTSEIVIECNIKINGNSHSISRASSATTEFRIFFVDHQATLTLNNVTVEGAYTSQSGAGILALGATIILENNTVIQNNVIQQNGGHLTSTQSS